MFDDNKKLDYDNQNRVPSENDALMNELLMKLGMYTVEEIEFMALVYQVKETIKNDKIEKEKEEIRKKREKIKGERRRIEIMDKFLDPICHICGKKFKNLYGLSIHLNLAHNRSKK